MKNPLRIKFGTDFHTNHKRVPAIITYKGIVEAFPLDVPANIDLFINGGDWTDRQGTLSEPDSYVSMESAAHILKYCAKNNIKLRIVEGTRSHDRGQSMMFMEINRIHNLGCDVKYFRELTIEYIEDLGINILYLPDEWHHDPKETYRQAKELMAARGLNKVDIAVVHGGFKFQFPNIDLPGLHDEAAWSELVNYIILSGHIHKRGRCLKVQCGGAFNRHTHDDTDAKGHHEITIEDGKVTSVKFIENKRARVFISVQITGHEPKDIINLILSETDKVPEGTAIRLEYREGDPIKAVREVVEAYFHQCVVTDTKIKEKGKKETKRLFSSDVFKPVEITRFSVAGLITERMEKKGDPDIVRDTAQALLKDLIENELRG